MTAEQIDKVGRVTAEFFIPLLVGQENETWG